MSDSFTFRSLLTQTCSGSTDKMMSSYRVGTITFPTILLSTPPIHIDPYPGLRKGKKSFEELFQWILYHVSNGCS